MKSLNEICRRLWREYGVVKLYARGRKRFGTRSHILIVPATFCTIEAARMIAESFAGRRFGQFSENRVVVLEHEIGCCSVGIDESGGLRILRNASNNPNIAGVLVVSLGCGSHCSTADQSGESTRTGNLITSIQGPRRQEEVVVQGPGGRDDAVRLGVQKVEAMIGKIERIGRVEASLADIVPGVMNGSSDPTSGLFTNPAVGSFCDFLMNGNGRIAFSQTTEMLGAEKILLARADNERVRLRMSRLLSAATTMRLAVELEGVESEPTQGNLRSGISTLKEKSIGTLFKIGNSASHSVVEILPHGKTINSKSGIHLVDGPGQDVLCMSGLVTAGVNVVLFTTGRGAPTGSPLAPTIKITSNLTTRENMPELIDVYLPVENIFEQGKSLGEIALQTLVPYVHAVASGELTAAERSGQRDFQVRQWWPIN